LGRSFCISYFNKKNTEKDDFKKPYILMKSSKYSPDVPEEYLTTINLLKFSKAILR